MSQTIVTSQIEKMLFEGKKKKKKKEQEHEEIEKEKLIEKYEDVKKDNKELDQKLN